MKKTFYLAIILLLVLGAVVYFIFFSRRQPVEWTAEKALRPAAAPLVKDGREVETLVRAIDNSLRYFEKQETAAAPQQWQSEVVPFGREQVPLFRIQESLLDFKARLNEYGLTERFFRYVRQNYRFYRSAARDVLFTGYFEADLKGSLTPSPLYRYPLYRTPEDLYRLDLASFSFFREHPGLPRLLRGRLAENRTIVPYYTREEIDYEGKLAGRGLEIAWIDNPIDVFFLQIQGSGIVELDSGGTLRVNYDESNGQSYYSIGRLLVEREILTLEEVSMQSIRHYLEAHPEEMKEIFIANPSYVFFREVKDGPMGSLGVPVTPYRSIATDRYLFPRGALCYIETRLPVFDDREQVTGWQDYSGFVLNQDTGGAIRTPGRVDLFTGYGKKSRLIAGYLKQKGTFYFLIKTP
jgi:membrane-bound lytic murein transglycosylase A